MRTYPCVVGAVTLVALAACSSPAARPTAAAATGSAEATGTASPSGATPTSTAPSSSKPANRPSPNATPTVAITAGEPIDAADPHGMCGTPKSRTLYTALKADKARFAAVGKPTGVTNIVCYDRYAVTDIQGGTDLAVVVFQHTTTGWRVVAGGTTGVCADASRKLRDFEPRCMV